MAIAPVSEALLITFRIPWTEQTTNSLPLRYGMVAHLQAMLRGGFNAQRGCHFHSSMKAPLWSLWKSNKDMWKSNKDTDAWDNVAIVIFVYLWCL